MNTSPISPTAVIARRIKELRRRRGWTAAQLGAKLQHQGVNWDRFTVANLESGKRQNVTVVELLAIAAALDVAPVNLLVPIGSEPYQVMPDRTEDADTVRAWVRGEQPLPGTAPESVRTFYAEASLADLQRSPR